MVGDCYDSCRLLLPGLIERFEVQGEVIAMVPNRDTLLVGGSEDEQSLEMMLTLGRQALTEPRPVSPFLLRFDGDAWVDWSPPREHPAAAGFRELATQYFFQEYHEQTDLLNQLNERKKIDQFVASYSIVDKEDQDFFTYAVWPDGVDDALLPRAEWVIFSQGEGPSVAMATWDRVEQVVGHLLRPTEHYPSRVRVTEFPTTKELEQLGTANP
jgi:hypothetical protein